MAFKFDDFSMFFKGAHAKEVSHSQFRPSHRSVGSVLGWSSILSGKPSAKLGCLLRLLTLGLRPVIPAAAVGRYGGGESSLSNFGWASSTDPLPVRQGAFVG